MLWSFRHLYWKNMFRAIQFEEFKFMINSHFEFFLLCSEIMRVFSTKILAQVHETKLIISGTRMCVVNVNETIKLVELYSERIESIRRIFIIFFSVIATVELGFCWNISK